ncbi:hypothetical protein GF402_07275 [Candidatus Fermentibacteria bacterium]|nr:hypothetical protein [Candidatus Fermentibacteria bacterium]
MTADRGKGLVRTLGRVALVLLGALAVFVLAHHGRDWYQQATEYGWDLDPLLVVVSIILVLASLLIVPAGWVMIARALGSDLQTNVLRGTWFTSQLGRYIPGKIWLFVGRAGALRSGGISSLRAASAPILELMHTVASAGLVAFLALLLAGGPMLSSTLWTILLVSGVLLLLLPFLRPVQKLVYRLRFGPTDREPAGLSLGDSSKVVLVYAIVWILRGISLWLWLRSLGLGDQGILLCMTAVPLSWMAGYATFFVPGGVGVREAVIVALLANGTSAGPLLLAVLGQRLVLGVCEVVLASLSFRSVASLIGRRGEKPIG